MEGEFAPQVAGTESLYQASPKTFLDRTVMAKKRDFQWSAPDFLQPQHRSSTFLANRGSSRDWNMSAWDWDSVMFVAKPTNHEDQCSNAEVSSVKEKEPEKPLHENKITESEDILTLKLGDASYKRLDFAGGRPNKRPCTSSPSSNYPMCQVDDCKEDLSNAKDYHRRHKVCEVHSKTSKALVGKQIQRFCQQCSRFHPLQEFDEGKRSCRRRLAGHNRRRRKAQPVDESAHVLLRGGRGNANSGKADLVNLLIAFAHLQGTKGNNMENAGNRQALTDKENHLRHILSKINPLPDGDASGRFVSLENLDLDVNQVALSLEHASTVVENKAAGHKVFPAANSTPLRACTGAETPENGTKTQVSRENGNLKHPGNMLNYVDQIVGSKSDSYCCVPQSGFQQSRLNHSANVLEPHVQTGLRMPLQLFRYSSEDDSMTEVQRGRNYFSSDSSNPSQEWFPSSSPVAQKLFPLHSEQETTKQGRLSTIVNNCSPVEVDNGNRMKILPQDELRIPSDLTHSGNESGSSNRIGAYISSSGSDNSPSSSNPDKQDQTGRIIFKLFGKDPSDLPDAIRLQIFNWLKNSPTEMESYIKPGCVFLAVYVSMPSLSWRQLRADFRQQITSLVQDSSSDFWRNARFFVHIDTKFASHKDGRIRLCKSGRGFNTPELFYVSPLAVVSAEHISATLKGRNLGIPGNRVYCTQMGGYVAGLISEDSLADPKDEFISVNFNFPAVRSQLFGRCFIEVGNDLRGDSFPIIIADPETCAELRSLEPELEQVSRASSDDHVRGVKPASSREGIVRFLNELGWLFQSPGDSIDGISACKRFSHLLAFAVERDWTSLIKRILDILLQRSLEKGVMEELMKMLSEIHLLHHAVRRRCLKMVNLLLHYQCRHRGPDFSRGYIFSPNSVGPSGITPLHLGADAQGCEELVDALTNDQQNIGLSAWTSARDAEGVSPSFYALMKNHHSYNNLVQRKLLDKAKGQVSICVASSNSLEINDSSTSFSRRRSCAQCAVSTVGKRGSRLFGGRRSFHRTHLISILAVAAVCLCVSIIFRGRPEVGKVAPFMWENIYSGWQ